MSKIKEVERSTAAVKVNEIPIEIIDFLMKYAREGITGMISFEIQTGECRFINRVAREVLELTHLSQESAGRIAVGADFETNFGTNFEIDNKHPSVSQLGTLNLADLFPVEDRPGFGRKLTQEMVSTPGYYSDVYFKRHDGNFVFANLDVHHISPTSDTKRCVLAFQDITLQKKLQRDLLMKQEQVHLAHADLLTQNKQLRELDLAKDRFIALTTHELRTPLSAIVAMSEALVLGFAESPEQHAELQKTIHEQSLHLMELVNDILDFAKVRAGKMDYFVEQMDIRSLLKKVASNFESMATQEDLKFTLELTDAPVMAFADHMRLREVIDNVVNNAIKYNRRGGILRIRVSSIEGYVRISVADSGRGIPPEMVNNVFNEFETLNNVAQHHKGTGLGMPISKSLMAAMGGELTLTSEVGVGSEFHIDVPTSRVLAAEFYRARPDSWGDFAA